MGVGGDVCVEMEEQVKIILRHRRGLQTGKQRKAIADTNSKSVGLLRPPKWECVDSVDTWETMKFCFSALDFPNKPC